MKDYKVEFSVNGKINKHGLYLEASDILSALTIAHERINRILHRIAPTVEIVSISLEKHS